MDPITQAVLGGLAAQTLAKPKQAGKAVIIGAVAGMAADLDVLIRSSADPLLALEYHRQFTHSLLFIPVGGLFCALVIQRLWGRRWQLPFVFTLACSILGYGTHGLLDACTSYGTQLFWPFSNQRVAWDMISVVDPLFTLPLLALVILAAKHQSKAYVLAGMAWGALYLSLGLMQHERAIDMGQTLAASRGHSPERLEVKPSFANIAVWKLVYETETDFHVDAIKPGISKPVVWPGDSIAKLDLDRDLPWLDARSQQAEDIERFRRFSANYIAVDKHDRSYIADIRYSLLPQQITPLWGIGLTPHGGKHTPAQFVTKREDTRTALWVLAAMVLE